jgi:hypothetical protein
MNLIMRHPLVFLSRSGLISMVVLLAGCQFVQPATPTLDPVEQSHQMATRLAVNFLVKATELTQPSIYSTSLPGGSMVAETISPAPTYDPSTIQILGVSYQKESGFITVVFKAPPEVASKWTINVVFIISETTGIKYNQIPELGPLGPAFARPVHAGQEGYVMFLNSSTNPLQVGDLVTVWLGKFKQQHVLVTDH